MSEKGKKPKIRFKGFNDEWEERKLGEIANKVSDKNIYNAILETFTNSAEYGVISQRDFFDHDIAKTEKINGYYIIQSNDFVYNPRISVLAPCGPINCNRLKRSGVMSPLYTIFRTYNNIDISYLEWYFKSNYWHTYMYFNGDTGARADRFSIKDEIFFKMPIPFLNIKEQQKIGKYFEKIDNLITLNQKKYYKLVNIKKSMLEKMFPKNENTVPEIRFKGFYEPWEKRKLGDVVNVYDGTHQTPHYKENGIMFLSVENIATLKSDKFISEEAFQKDYKVYPQKGDVLMTRIGDVGTPNIVETTEKLAFYVSLALLKPIKINSYFLCSVILSPLFKKGLKNRTLVTAIPQKINKDEIGKIDMMLPISLREQEKIGEYFYNLDRLISLQQKKLEKLKNLKKAFLEKMFV